MERERDWLTAKVVVVSNMDPLKYIVNVEYKLSTTVFALNQAQPVDSGIMPRHRVVVGISPDAFIHLAMLSFCPRTTAVTGGEPARVHRTCPPPCWTSSLSLMYFLDPSGYTMMVPSRHFTMAVSIA